ncbi:MAG: bifunctional 5,10-methylene-tetrahydrofolate dehydrogenase/5,10-methylene-tetrahydrofolate cyclohydrolase [Clostridiales Family XIII bacterium]|jgi:methylenetetrahydrofolate dehydrogenase (NADP+)/methenyltetrahydrofolate cyclohydrolase|nr:bifunctional 5,10-methylene-tetrahydrofolate dehydrogenase/5,10-methylene-tetrahydrofolate cyclohydrolase [Clostridiales Family XIII bacterium]
MAELLRGAPVANALCEAPAREAAALAKKGVVPALAIVRIGERPDDIAYERGATKRCEKVGVRTRGLLLPADVPQDGLAAALRELNADAAIHGILLLRPLPAGMDEDALRNIVSPAKDVDGATDLSSLGIFTGKGDCMAPCTAQACMEILDFYGVDLKGKRAVVVGRSLVVGKPVAMLLLERHATVTIAHSRSADLPAICRNAEILIASAGRAGCIDRSCLSPGQIVLDVGVNADENGGLCGDVDFGDALEIVAAVTPVPGGVGAVTASVLAKNTVAAAKRASQ